MSQFDRRKFLQGLTATVTSVGTLVGGSGKAMGQSGSEEWTFFAGDTIRSSPTAVGSWVYFGTDAGEIIALNRNTARERWRFSPENLAVESVESAPMVVDETLFVGIENNIFSVDVDSGQRNWEFETGGTVNSSPVVVDGVLYVGSDDNNLYAIDALSGDEVWSFSTRGGIESSPVVYEDVVFAGSKDNTLYAVDVETGRSIWEFETNGQITTAPTATEDSIYVSSADDHVYSLDRNSGEKEWEYEFEFGGLSSPTVANIRPHVRETVYIQNEIGAIHALNAELGSHRFEVHPSEDDEGLANQEPVSPPLVVQTTVIFGNDSGTYAIDGGREDIEFEEDDAMTSPPTIADGTLYFGYDSTFIAMEPGSSQSGDGSRSFLAAHGHSEEWKYADQTLEEEEEEETGDDDTTEGDEENEDDIEFDREPEVREQNGDDDGADDTDDTDEEPELDGGEDDASSNESNLIATSLFGTIAAFTLALLWGMKKLISSSQPVESDGTSEESGEN